MIAPRLQAAAADPQLRGAPLAVYVHLVYTLDPVHFAPVKLAALARVLHLKEVTAGWALRRLVTAGYLERGPKRDRVATYRLVWAAPAQLSA